jgi:hypothetical protein
MTLSTRNPVPGLTRDLRFKPHCLQDNGAPDQVRGGVSSSKRPTS